MADKYIITPRDGFFKHCPTCNSLKQIYVVVEKGATKMCCGTCQRIYKEEKHA